MIARILWIVFPLGLIIVIQTWLLNLHYPLVGTDTEYYLARLIDAFIHLKINGIFTIQWWTPTFGGGIPAYPNPLHLQFSITPYLMFFFSPWIATQITYAIMASLAYFLIYNYVSYHTNWGFYTAICTACVFTTNGYFLNHILVGHLNYCSFPFIAIIPFLISSSWSSRKCIIIFSISVSVLIYSAGFPTIFLLYISLGQLFLFLPLIKKESLPFKRVLKILIISHLIILGLVCSKFIAVSLHMDVFPRIKEFFTWQPYYQVILVSTFAQLFSWRILIPFESILPIPADSILFWLIGSRYEFWENDVSLSPVVPFIIFIFIYLRFSDIKKFLIISVNRNTFIAFLFILWFSIEMTMGKGLFWSLIRALPIIKSTHVNVRYAGALTLTISILFAFCFSKLIDSKNSKYREWITLLIIGASFASMATYQSITKQKGAYRSFDVNDIENSWSDFSSTEYSKKVSKIVEISSKEQIRLFSIDASSFNPNDSLYGYNGEFFQSSLSVGKIDKIDKNGFYNFHNPISFYSPSNHSLKREKIHSSDHENFHLFINRKQPSWKLPNIQIVANYLSLITFFIFFSYLIYLTVIKFIRI